MTVDKTPQAPGCLQLEPGTAVSAPADQPQGDPRSPTSADSSAPSAQVFTLDVVKAAVEMVKDETDNSNLREKIEKALAAAHEQLHRDEVRDLEKWLQTVSFKKLTQEELAGLVLEAQRSKAAEDPGCYAANIDWTTQNLHAIVDHCEFVGSRLQKLDTIPKEERLVVLQILNHFPDIEEFLADKCPSLRQPDGSLQPGFLAEMKAVKGDYPGRCERLRQIGCPRNCFVKSPAAWPARLQQFRAYDFEETTIIHPALGFPEGQAYVTQPFLEEVVEKTDEGTEMEKVKIYKVQKPKVITSDGRVLEFSKKQSKDPAEITTVRGTNWMLAGDPPVSCRQRWSKRSIEDFLLSRVEKVDPARVYMDTYSLLRRFCWLEFSAELHLMVLYVLMTYFHPMFASILYLFLNGMWGAGKSTTERTICHLSHNGFFTVEPSPAALFRTINAEQSTFVIDEKENATNREQAKNSDLVAILKAGYQRGATVARCNTDRGIRVEQFHVFGPKIIANIFGLEEVLADRCVPIHLKEAPPEVLDALEKEQPAEDDTQFQHLRDQYYLLVMQYHKEFKSVLDSCRGQALPGASHRNRELFFPLYVVANFVETHGHQPIVIDEQPVSLLDILAKLVASKVEQRKIQKAEMPEIILNSTPDLLTYPPPKMSG